MNPKEAIEEYIEVRKYENPAKSTINNYSYRLSRFVEFCERAGIEDMEFVTGRTVEKFKKDRVERDDVNPVTLEQQLRTLHHFLEWCEANEFIEDGVADRMMIPGATPEEQVRHDAIDADRAREIVDYLQKFEYASRQHIVFHLLWHTGMRIGAVRAIDVDDFNRVENPDGTVSHNLTLRHRPASETPLKLDGGGERNVTIADETLVEALGDWIEHNRPGVEDDYGREPLIATHEGRASKGTIRHDIYTVVQPCRYRKECPHGKEISDCEWRHHGKRSKCPSSTYPHAIRSGAVTEHLNEDIPKEIVSGRANMSVEILEKHYDERTQEERRKRREDYL